MGWFKLRILAVLTFFQFFALLVMELVYKKANGTDICSMKKKMVERKFNDSQASWHCFKEEVPRCYLFLPRKEGLQIQL